MPYLLPPPGCVSWSRSLSLSGLPWTGQVSNSGRYGIDNAELGVITAVKGPHPLISEAPTPFPLSLQLGCSPRPFLPQRVFQHVAEGSHLAHFFEQLRRGHPNEAEGSAGNAKAIAGFKERAPVISTSIGLWPLPFLPTVPLGDKLALCPPIVIGRAHSQASSPRHHPQWTAPHPSQLRTPSSARPRGDLPCLLVHWPPLAISGERARVRLSWDSSS